MKDRIYTCGLDSGVVSVIVALCIFCNLGLFRPKGLFAQVPLLERVSFYLQEQIEAAVRQPSAASIPLKITVGGEPIRSSFRLLRFYDQRDYRPGWSDDHGPFPQVYNLIDALRQAPFHGLRSEHYHLPQIMAFLAGIYETMEDKGAIDPEALGDLDLLLTDAFLTYGRSLSAGQVDPDMIEAGWFGRRGEGDLVDDLQRGLYLNQVDEILESFHQPQAEYARLGQALRSYRGIAARGGWPVLANHPGLLKMGSRGPHIRDLVRRLWIEGDLDDLSFQIHGDVFDQALKRAVIRFQRRNGLSADGVVGPDTRAALNIPVEERIQQLELNMERWRWLPHDLGERYVVVNIASFTLEAIEDSRPVLDMRVIVGSPFRSTPAFSARIRYLVANPYWHIPPRIAREEILPKIQRDPDYLARHHITVLRGWNKKGEEIDPNGIVWAEVTAGNFRFRLRQEPGPWNPLGRVKFIFPNRFSIHLHDTPYRDHFQKTRRNLSHGCIRIEKPVELAEYLLRGDPAWTPEKIRAAVKAGVRQKVPLPEPVPIYLVYFTARVDEDGLVCFYRDIDGRDLVLAGALRLPPGPW
ncbi:MAG: L,D-transpeptidase family protein [bacterium]